jgi:hypothetical protein
MRELTVLYDADHAATLREVTVVADDGSVYVGGGDYADRCDGKCDVEG